MRYCALWKYRKLEAQKMTNTQNFKLEPQLSEKPFRSLNCFHEDKAIREIPGPSIKIPLPPPL